MSAPRYRLERLLELCRRIRWTEYGRPALDDDRTAAAIEDLFIHMADDAMARAHPLPVIDELMALATDAARAEWLLRCPHGVIADHHADIARALHGAGFGAGGGYLDIELAAAQSVRGLDGHPPYGMRLAVLRARRNMKQIAKGAR